MPSSIILHYIFLVVCILLSNASQLSLSAHLPSYYFDQCAPSTCGDSLLHFPLGINPLCSSAYITTSCENGTVFITDDESPQIKYKLLQTLNESVYARMSIQLVDTSLFGCDPIPPYLGQSSQKWLTLGNFYNFYMNNRYKTGIFFNCSGEPQADMRANMRSVPCLECGNTSNLCYFYNGYVDRIENCLIYRAAIPNEWFDSNFSGIGNLRKALQVGFRVDWDSTCGQACMDSTGGRCGFRDENSGKGDELCFCRSSVHQQNCSDGMPISIGGSGGAVGMRGKLIAGIGVGLLLVLGCVCYVCIRRRHNRLKVLFRLGGQDEQALRRYLGDKNASIETFLQDYASGVPARFSYKQIKKYTENFSHKVGQGGFGSVFKAKLPNGYFVAVKLLDETKQSEAQFLNEVRTIGQIHHNHLVRLLGFCIDHSRRALIYEFMENGSLDKYIHRKGDEAQQKLSWNQLHEIALGTARGVAYLHEECQSRILHCDIKPHNILLDENFHPKVSDFGLAQMVNRENSHISLTHGRGTPGYAPPEMWFKNYGPVTEKSDVYSFGMLVLEMVGERRNFQGDVSKSSETYFPEWVYVHHVVQHDDDGGGSKWHTCNGQEEERLARTMELVGLWCIQFSPARRPAMRKAIEMLEGSVAIDIPPVPFDKSMARGNGSGQKLREGKVPSLSVPSEEGPDEAG